MRLLRGVSPHTGMAEEGAKMRQAYAAIGANHVYRGKNVGRGGRQRSKVMKALRGIASYDLIEAVMREDARSRRAQVVEREQVGNLSLFQA